MRSIVKAASLLFLAVFVFGSGIASAQVNFEKTDYYLSLGV
jgi:hypothetical protein